MNKKIITIIIVILIIISGFLLINNNNKIEIINNDIGKDYTIKNNHLYFKGMLVKEIDLKSLVVLDKEYIKDKDSVYLQNNKI